MTDPITKEGRAKFIEYARIIHSNPRMMPVGIEMLNKALAYEAALTASEAEVERLREALEAMKRHIPEAHGVHPNPEYQIVEDMAAALVQFKEVE